MVHQRSPADACISQISPHCRYMEEGTRVLGVNREARPTYLLHITRAISLFNNVYVNSWKLRIYENIFALFLLSCFWTFNVSSVLINTKHRPLLWKSYQYFGQGFYTIFKFDQLVSWGNIVQKNIVYTEIVFDLIKFISNKKKLITAKKLVFLIRNFIESWGS